MVIGILLSLLLDVISPADLPNPKLTPGRVDPACTVEMVCKSGYTAKVRHVTDATKKKVYAEYGIKRHKPGEYEVDHLISLELCGSNDIENLWPQSYITKPWNAHVKDTLENDLHARVCNREMALDTAQKIISENWINAMRSLDDYD